MLFSFEEKNIQQEEIESDTESAPNVFVVEEILDERRHVGAAVLED